MSAYDSDLITPGGQNGPESDFSLSCADPYLHPWITKLSLIVAGLNIWETKLMNEQKKTLAIFRVRFGLGLVELGQIKIDLCYIKVCSLYETKVCANRIF